MQFAFDLISDLHVETWGDFDWSSQATSAVAVVAGDVAADRTVLLETLKHLGECYQAVFYIDGNIEHEFNLDNVADNYADLVHQINCLHNVVFLQDNVVVIDGVAIVGTHGWWTYDFDLDIAPETCIEWMMQKYDIGAKSIKSMHQTAMGDSMYMMSSVRRLQKHNDVKKIVMVTHTVPDPALIAHDIELDKNPRKNVMGNRHMMQALAADPEKKIHTWCFGHYHGSVDQTRGGVRFVNNCRGRKNTPYSRTVYYPQRILVDF